MQQILKNCFTYIFSHVYKKWMIIHRLNITKRTKQRYKKTLMINTKIFPLMKNKDSLNIEKIFQKVAALRAA